MEGHSYDECQAFDSTKGTLATAKEEKANSSQKSHQSGWSAPWRWHRISSSIRRRKLPSVVHEHQSPADQDNQKIVPTNCSPGNAFSSEKSSKEDISPKVLDNVYHSKFNFAYLRRHSSQHKSGDQKGRSKDQCYSSTSLSHKYQPKHFEDIYGHEIIIKVISNAVQKKKVANFYLFHGPSGTGKTSAARVFAMALQCQTASPDKPCSDCAGCSRSIHIMDLCSGSRTTGFQRISTLIHSTSFTQALQGFKVFIVEDCHLLTAEAWDEILGIVKGECGSTIVFVLITSDAAMVPKTIYSRCQKFCFPKLKDIDIRAKMTRIAAQENVGVEEGALQLIVAKAAGSLREAENILDQLTLLGPRITTAMVQQIVGLVSEEKLINLLATALSGDTEKTVISTRELVETGVEIQAIVSQLASLIINILSGASAAIPRSLSSAGPSQEKRQHIGALFVNTPSESLCHALKILVETEKQSNSSVNQTASMLTAILQIASQNFSSAETILHRDNMVCSGTKSNAESAYIKRDRLSQSQGWIEQPFSSATCEQQTMNRNVKSTKKSKTWQEKADEIECNLTHLTDMEEIWLDLLGKVKSRYTKELLSHQVKLASLTVSSANVILHLMFKRPEDKMAAQMSEESISNALKNAIGCPVIVNMSLEPVDLRNIEACQQTECGHSWQQERTASTPESVQIRSGDNICESSHHKLPPLRDDNLRLKKLKDNYLISQGQDRFQRRELDANRGLQQKSLSFSGISMNEVKLDESAISIANTLACDQSTADIGHLKVTKEKPRHRWLSLSSIQQSDASVERYSQDILFENANREKESRNKRNKKKQKAFSAHEDFCSEDIARSRVLHGSWSCKDILFQRRRN